MMLITVHSVFLVLMGMFFIYLRFSKRISENKFDTDASDLTVIIPFRNESCHIERLVSCIKAQVVLPKAIIFVNDHSTDDSVEKLKSLIEEDERFSLLHLPHELFGKKHAIRYALNEVETTFLLTLDADTYFENYFFASIQMTSSMDMVVQPVVMKGSSLFGKYVAFEYNFYNAFTALISSKQILNASGANLLIKKDAFEYFDRFETHKHIPSGDDYFLLGDFLKSKAVVVQSTDEKRAVKTEAKERVIDYLSQRLRWLSKTKFKPNLTNVFLGIFFVLYFNLHLITLLIAFVHHFWILLGSLIAVRFIWDALVYYPYSKRFELRFLPHFLMLFQVIYPLIFTFIVILSWIWKPNWKGRRT